MIRESLDDRMRGRWHEILPLLGVPTQFLNGKHQACPLCGGKDRARFTDKDGAGMYFCNQCGAGSGVMLVMKINDWDFKTAAERIEAVAGDAPRRIAKPKADPARQLAAMKHAWGAAGPVGETVKAYLRGRAIGEVAPLDVRGSAHEMLALVRRPDGAGCQVHRTLLTQDGRKADGQCRLFMPGPIPKGAAVRLAEAAPVMGVAEGIETALSAAALFQIPVWAALNATLLRQWEVPPGAGVCRVVVFADNDANFTGQAAAYELARRLVLAKLEVAVELPDRAGSDWNDVLVAKAGIGTGAACVVS